MAAPGKRNNLRLPKPKLILYPYVLFTFYLLMSHVLAAETAETNSNSCNVSRETVETVLKCPNTEQSWKKAATRKNCAAYASQCDPDRLVYHCVINPYVNETLEVCAYVKNIVLGQCAEYDTEGNVIQRNEKTNCTGFFPKPCPQVYKSNELFKYPGCYELVKTSAPYHSTSLGSRRSSSLAVIIVFIHVFSKLKRGYLHVV